MFMRVIVVAVVATGALVASASAQQDSVKRARDSVAVADSIALVKELTKAAEPSAARQSPGGAGPSNPRLLPDISAVGDLMADFSKNGSTQEDGRRFSIREVEIALQAAVDPYFRGDVFLGISDTEGISIEQAFLTTTSLPWGLEARIGRFLMPFGKQNTTHRHDLHTFEYSQVGQQFLGAEGLKGTGVYLSKVLAPFGFYQELQLAAVDQFGESEEEGLVTEEPVNKKLGNLGYSARLRNYVDLSQSTNLELSASAITGKRAQPIVGNGTITAIPARQTLLGLDFTYRWRPLQQGLYRSFILQAEVMKQINEDIDDADYLGPIGDRTGWYVFGRYQLSRRTFLGARYDRVGEAATVDDRLSAASGYLEFFPSEFSKLTFGYERVVPPGGVAYGRILMQATFAVGPHKPHPF